jgi:RNA polymerase primary sigma factor
MTPSPRTRRLTAAEEQALARRIERGDPKAKEEMVERNLGLVVWVARAYRGHGVPLADLVQDGTVGLLRATERFDHRRGLRFSTYAAWWIRRAILDAIADAGAIRIPAAAGRRLATVRRVEAELERAGRRRASDAEIAECADLSATTVRSLRSAAQVTASLDAPIGEGAMPLSDMVADERAVDPPAHALASERRREVSTLLRLLPERHREVLARRYGLSPDGAQSHAEIGASLGVGEERSRQIEREALHRLRSIAA